MSLTNGTDPDALHRRPSRRRETILLLCLIGVACLAAVVIAGGVLLRLAPALLSSETSTPTPAHGATPPREGAGAIQTELSSASDDKGPSEGGLADTELRAKVWSTIVSFYTNVRGCTEITSGVIRATQQPEASGSWEETWEVSACGEGAELKIHFTVASDGGIYYDISE